MTDFNNPEQRLDYLLHHGVDAYNKAMEDHFAKRTGRARRMAGQAMAGRDRGPRGRGSRD